MNVELETMENTTTHTTFYVIGKTPSLKVGLRVWEDTWNSVQHGYSVIFFRMRVEAGNDKVQAVGPMANFEFPEQQWTGGNGETYVSKAGAMRLEYPMGYDFEKVIQHAKDVGAFNSLYSEIVKGFPALTMNISEEDFAEFFLKQYADTATSEVVANITYVPIPFQIGWGGKAPQSGQSH